MRFRVEVIYMNDEGAEQWREVIEMDRQELAVETLGLTLAEGKAILRGLQDFVASSQISEDPKRRRSSASPRVQQAMIQSGCTDSAQVTVLSDGDAGLRAIQREVAPKSEHILDWFHLAMRFQHVIQVARGLSHDQIRTLAKLWVTGRVDRAKWCLWNGKSVKGLHYLQAIQDWLTPGRQRGAPGLTRLSTALRDLLQYLTANRDTLPNYGKRYRGDQPISTAWVESAVNEVIAKRMVKKQQMRWNRFTVQPFLTVRVHVLNGTLEQVFRTWYASFRPSVAA